MKLYTHKKTDAGELIRYMLVQAGEKFEDLRVNDAKEIKDTAPYGSLPVLVLNNGKSLGGTLAIAQYLGEKYSMTFDDSFNRGQLNNMCETVLEAVVFLSQYWSQSDSSGRNDRKKEVLEKDLPPKLASINQKIKESNSTSGFCCDHLTYPDFFVFFLFHEVLPRAYPKEVQETERKKYPEVTKLCEAVVDCPT